MLEMYKELGYETKLKPLSPEKDKECQACYEADEAVYGVYIKEQQAGI